MEKAILGKKLGMTQVFADNGTVIPVTVIQAGPCFVAQVKTVESDGYNAIVVAFEDKKEKLVNKPEMGLFKKAELTPKRYLREFKVENVADYKVGQEIKCDIFNADELVDASALSKGHGFSGMIKRWGAHHQRNTHGGNKVHRAVGSLGATSAVARVLPGRHMPGQFGNVRKTILNLKIVKVDAERNLILVKGAVPGARGALVTLRDAVKA